MVPANKEDGYRVVEPSISADRFSALESNTVSLVYESIAGGVMGGYVEEDVYKRQVIALSMVVGLLLCYAFGTLWYLILTGKGLVPALMGCVVPFLPGDAAKIIVATLLTKALRRYLR